MYHKRGQLKTSRSSRVVHARLDAKTERVLGELTRRTGLSESELLRRGLLALSEPSPSRRRPVIGVGKFDSGKTDLGSNKQHLRGFGNS
jgi:hypothetical protein